MDKTSRYKAKPARVNGYSTARFYKRCGSFSLIPSRRSGSNLPETLADSSKASPVTEQQAKPSTGSVTEQQAKPSTGSVTTQSSLPEPSTSSHPLPVASAQGSNVSKSSTSPAEPASAQENKGEQSLQGPNNLPNIPKADPLGQRKPLTSHKNQPRLKQRVVKTHSGSPGAQSEFKQPRYPSERQPPSPSYSNSYRASSYEFKPSKLRHEVDSDTTDNNPTTSTKNTPSDSKPRKMADSDASDEVMLHRGSRFRGINRRSRGTSNRRSQSRGRRAPNNAIPSSSGPGTCEQSGSKVTNTKNETRGQHHNNEVSSCNPSSDSGPSQQKVQPMRKGDSIKVAPPDALEELKRLREEIVAHAHQNRLRDLDYPTANPEALAKVRDGSGTDPKSDVYQELAKFRLVPGSTNLSNTSFPSSHNTSASSQGSGSFSPGLERYQAQWNSYAESPAVYPIVEDGQLVLSLEPGPDHQSTQHTPRHDFNLQVAEIRHTRLEQAPENKWVDALAADWEYRPRACSSFEAFRDWFRRWLDSTMAISCEVDINHQAFFDGTAHPDGTQSLFIPNIEYPVVFLDMEDEKTRLHHHETVEGYCHNLEIHIKKEAEEEQSRRQRARTVYLEGARTPPEPNPNVPRANVYLRPVEITDIPELISIYNWYAHHTTLSVDVEAVDEAEALQRIEDCRSQRLPFIVAAECRAGPVRDPNATPERILGYALATDTLGQRSTGRFTVELELFVRNEFQRRGIGRCLMDKLLEVCDATHIPKRGYFFRNNAEEETGYDSGGRRRLARLLFTISYPNDDRYRYQWVQEWLEREYQFKQQGLLKGARIKFETFLDVSYLVRNVGYSEGGSSKVRF
ncbi:hypothetical protein MW887_009617 [Aspergillus wentii]|nr:hypothetical protein MW887_009617 [Aspergillus wentii]